MRKLPSLLATLVVCAAAALPAAAQLGISGAFTASRLNHPVTAVSSPTMLYGSTVSIYYQRGTFVALGGDIRATFLGHDGITFNSGTAGPRVALKSYRPPACRSMPRPSAASTATAPAPAPTTPSRPSTRSSPVATSPFFPASTGAYSSTPTTGSSGSLSSNSLSTGIVVRDPLQPRPSRPNRYHRPTPG